MKRIYYYGIAFTFYYLVVCFIAWEFFTPNEIITVLETREPMFRWLIFLSLLIPTWVAEMNYSDHKN